MSNCIYEKLAKELQRRNFSKLLMFCMLQNAMPNAMPKLLMFCMLQYARLIFPFSH
jgi:hypothetical protein